MTQYWTVTKGMESIDLEKFMTACYQAIADGAINPYYFPFGSGVDRQGAYYARCSIERFPVLAQYMDRPLDKGAAFAAYQAHIAKAQT
jgi:hypothetical protein